MFYQYHVEVYDYLDVSYELDKGKLEEDMNVLGADNWRVVSVCSYGTKGSIMVTFEREVEE